MSLRTVETDLALNLTAQGAGTVTSGPIAPSGQAANVVLAVHCSAIGGSPTLDVSLEESATGAGSWTAITGSGITQLTAAGNKLAFAAASKPYVRVTATVGGTSTPTATFKATVLVLAE